MPKKAQELIDKHQFEHLCAGFHPLREIAYHFRVSEDTVQRWVQKVYKKGFAAVYEYYSAGGHAAIRRAQLVKGVQQMDTQMLKFLGVNYLNQKVTADTEMNVGAVGGKLIISMGDSDSE